MYALSQPIQFLYDTLSWIEGISLIIKACLSAFGCGIQPSEAVASVSLRFSVQGNKKEKWSKEIDKVTKAGNNNPEKFYPSLSGLS